MASQTKCFFLFVKSLHISILFRISLNGLNVLESSTGYKSFFGFEKDKEILDKWKCISVFDLSTKTKIGSFLDRIVYDSFRNNIITICYTIIIYIIGGSPLVLTSILSILGLFDIYIYTIMDILSFIWIYIVCTYICCSEYWNNVFKDGTDLI